MTPEALAALHARAFAPERGWSAAEFTGLLETPHAVLLTEAQGFALVRTVAGESELLTLAVDPAQRRRGIADRLMRSWLSGCGAETAFLEVAADNRAALALYARYGFTPCGHRPGYYARPGTAPVDALLMRLALTPRRDAEMPDRR